MFAREVLNIARTTLRMRLVSLANCAETRDRTGDLQIFGLTLSQLSYRGRAIDMGVKMINASFLGRLVG